MEEWQKELVKAGEKLDLKVGFTELKGNSVLVRLVYKLSSVSVLIKRLIK